MILSQDMSSVDLSSANKLPKLEKPEDFIQWKRRTHAFLRRDDPLLVGLSDAPPKEPENIYLSWLKKSTKAKCNIVLSLGDTALSQTRLIVDDDTKTAQDLWKELARIYTMTNGQAIQNLKQKLDSLIYKEGADWNSHVSAFLTICMQLAAFDVELSEEDRASKLIRSLPESFSPIAMFCSLTDSNFDKIVSAVQSEIARRSNPHNPQNSSSSTQPRANISKRGNRRSNNKNARGGIRKNTGSSRDNCHYCGKKGHFKIVCRKRIADERSQNNQGATPSSGSQRRSRFGPSPNNRNQTTGNSNGWGNSGRSQGWKFQSNGQQPSNSHLPSGQQIQNLIAQLSALQSINKPQVNDEDDSRPFKGFMAKAKFRSKIACLSTEKTNDAYIDSGASHHFFFLRSAFITYSPISNETVRAASESTNLVGKGTVFIPIDGGIIVEGYHAPSFSSNILSVGLLKDNFDVLFSKTFRDFPGCFFLRHKTLELIHSIRERDGLFAISLSTKRPSSNGLALNARTNEDKQLDIARKWHNKTGHIHPDRYLSLARLFSEVPRIEKSVLYKLQCVPCLSAKAKRAPVRPSTFKAQRPLHLIHLDISGPVRPSLAGSTLTVAFLDDFSAKSDVYMISAKSSLPKTLMEYKQRSEKSLRTFGYCIQNIRLDRAGENSSDILIEFCKSHGIYLDYSPAYASESNGAAERLIQEHWMRARVLLFASQLPNNLWAEAIAHGNWLRNRLPAKRIGGGIPILAWDPSTRIDFKSLLEFGQPGFAFIYRPKATPQKKLLPRAVFGHFVGMHSDTTILRVYVPHSKSIIFTRAADFKKYTLDRLPGVDSLLDGLARQSELETSTEKQDSVAEEQLVQAMSAIQLTRPTLCLSAKRKRFDGDLPKSFAEACKNPNWCEGIDREYNAHVRRGTWIYVIRTSDMRPVPYIWVFRKKPLDDIGLEWLFKARCCLRGDRQVEFLDYDPDFVYAPVAAHESIRILICFAASQNLILEGADISNAYLYGNLDVPIIMEQPTDSSQIEARPGYVCKLVKSIYGARQAGEIWGSLLCSTLANWGFLPSLLDPRIYFLRRGSSFLIISIVVDDLAFASNSHSMLNELKQNLSATFDVKLFGELRSFIGWNICRTPRGVKVDQRGYARSLLKRFGLDEANAVLSPLPEHADVLGAGPDDDMLTPKAHAEYRSAIGGLLYLAVSTRPDLSYSVTVLARQLHAPTMRHMVLLKRVLRYVAGTVTLGLWYRRSGPLSSTSLAAFADADWGGCKDTRRSTTGYIISINKAPILWKSRRQTVIALSSAESEYVALSECAKTLSWVRKLFWEIAHQRQWCESYSFPSTGIAMDSTAAQALATNEQVSGRNKHIDLKVHHVKEFLKNKIIHLFHVPSRNQLADILTKAVDRNTFLHIISLLSLSSA